MPRSDPSPDFLALLGVLDRHEVEHIVVGGVSARLNGAPIITDDLDIVHRRTKANVRRVLAALAELEAVYRSDPRGLTPNETHLRGPGHQLLRTRHGALDVLGAIDAGRDYDDLLPDTHLLTVAGRDLRVLGLTPYIAMKERTGRDKDKMVLPVLRAALRESGGD